MVKMTRKGKFDSQIESFKHLKSQANKDIEAVKALSLTTSCNISDDINSIVKKIEEVLKQDQAKLREDPEYQEAMTYRKKLIEAKRNFEAASKAYNEMYEGTFNSKIKEIDELRNEERTKSKQLENEFHLWGSTLDDARAQNSENFEEKIKIVRDGDEYQDALLAKKNLIKLKMALIEALNDYERELTFNNENISGNNEEENKIKQTKKVRKIDSPNKTLSKLGINFEKVDGIILPTLIDGKKIVKKDNSNNSQNIEEIKYANKILILFEKVFNDLGFTSDDYKVFVGKSNNKMVRKLPYIVVELSKINKTIIVNNLYGESTFLCDNVFGNKEYLKLSKEDLLKQYGETITRVDFFDETSWSNQIKLRLLQRNIYVRSKNDGESSVNIPKTSKGLGHKNRISGLTDEEELALLKRYQDGKDITARDKIFYLYRGRTRVWLQKLLTEYKNDYVFTKNDIDDLHQQSDLIVLNAIEKFVKDLDDEKKFRTYLRNYYHPKISHYLEEKFELVDTSFSTYENPALVESIRDGGFKLKSLSPKGQEKLIKEEEASQIVEHSQKDEENTEKSTNYIFADIMDLLQDTSIESNPDKQQFLASLKKEVDRALSTLTPREADVVRLFFGINGGTPMSLEEIGEKFDLTRERVRQIKEKAIRRLKHTCRSKILKSYLDRY